MSIVETLKRTGRKVGKSLSHGNEAAANRDMDILDKLKQEHEQVQELLGKLVESDSAAERKSLLKKIKAALVPHVRAEEKAVYNAIIALGGKKDKQDGEEGYLEHALADNILATLGKTTNAMSPEFSAAAKVLREIVDHHVQEEERNVWSDVRENFSDEDRVEMNRQFEAAKKKVRIPA